MVDHCDPGCCATWFAGWEKTVESAEMITTAQEMPKSQLASFISALSTRTIPNGGRKQDRRHLHGSNRYLSQGQPWCVQKKRQHKSRRPHHQEGLLIEVDPFSLPRTRTYFAYLLLIQRTY